MSSYSLCDFSEDTGVGGLFGSTRLFLYLVHVRSVLRSTHRSWDFKAACYMKQIGLEVLPAVRAKVKLGVRPSQVQQASCSKTRRQQEAGKERSCWYSFFRIIHESHLKAYSSASSGVVRFWL